MKLKNLEKYIIRYNLVFFLIAVSLLPIMMTCYSFKLCSPHWFLTHILMPFSAFAMLWATAFIIYVMLDVLEML